MLTRGIPESHPSPSLGEASAWRSGSKARQPAHLLLLYTRPRSNRLDGTDRVLLALYFYHTSSVGIIVALKRPPINAPSDTCSIAGYSRPFSSV